MLHCVPYLSEYVCGSLTHTGLLCTRVSPRLEVGAAGTGLPTPRLHSCPYIRNGTQSGYPYVGHQHTISKTVTI